MRLAALFEASETEAKLKVLIPELVKAAQHEYDSWVEDGHGLCNPMAHALAKVINDAGLNAKPYSSYAHDWVVVGDNELIVDIDFRVYEKYIKSRDYYKKLKKVQIKEDDIVIAPWSAYYGNRYEDEF